MECLRLRESRLPGRSLIFAALGFFLFLSPIWAEVEAPAEPQILSVFPLGGQPGAELQASLRGHALDGAYALWFDTQHLPARILDLKPEQLPVSSARKPDRRDSVKEPIQVLKLNFQIPDAASPGAHSVRVLTPGGISNLWTLWVHAGPSVLEGDESHEMPTEAVELGADLPVSMGPSARKVKSTTTPSKCPGERPSASRSCPVPPWIPPLPFTTLPEAGSILIAPNRLAFNDETIAYPKLSTEAILTHRFETSGRYFVRVSGFLSAKED